MRNKMQIAVFMLFLVVLNFGVASAGKVRLPEGTEIKVKFDSNMVISSNKLQKDIPLLIYLAEDIKIGNTTIIETGAVGKAVVAEVQAASRPGKPGYIKIAFTELQPKGEFEPVDETAIKLTGEVDAKGKGQKLLSTLFIFGLFIRGTNGRIPTDITYPAQIAETVTLQSD